MKDVIGRMVFDRIWLKLQQEYGWKECKSGPLYFNGQNETHFLKNGEMLTISLDSCPDEEMLDKLFGKEENGTIINENGNKITKEFSNLDGNALLSHILNMGYKELYYTASFCWGAYSLKEKSILTFTEGDKVYIACISAASFKKEIEKFIKYQEEQGTPCSEIEDIRKDLRELDVF